MAGAYYNEFDAKAAAWLRQLIKAGLIADGDVDERSVTEVRADDLRGYTQCHFFAGIGVWSYALRLARWPDNRPVWTGSCPCQPFSAAGKGKAFEDERHLWPEFHRLIRQCAPPVVFGEQVASKNGLAWLDTVQSDMEASGYAIGAADLCAAGVGAPHIRQRLWFVGERLGNADRPRHEGHGLQPLHGSGEGRGQIGRVAGSGATGGLADARGEGRREISGSPPRNEATHGREGRNGGEQNADHFPASDGEDRRPRPVNGHWGAADWLHCRDGKWRPVEPGTFPLAHGAPARVGRLRAYGNAIVGQAAKEIIAAFMECRP